MDHDRPLIRPNPFPKRSNESGQRLRGIWNAEIRPRCEMEVLNHPFRVTLLKKTPLKTVRLLISEKVNSSVRL